jgi:probable O-glycosylation ligase (exosortase A-associated)
VALSDGTSILFLGYLVLLTFEWLGLQQEFVAFKTIRFTTLLGYGLLIGVIVQRGVGDILRRPQAYILLGLIVFSAASMMWAVVTSHAFNAIRPLVDYTVFFVLTAALVDRRERIEKLSWAMLLICSVLMFRNAAKFGETLRAGGFKAGYFLGDGNDLAWGMVIALPLIAYLTFVRRDVISRVCGVFGVGVCLFVVVGTSSRGGTLALASSFAFYLLYVSRKKMLGIASIAAFVLAIMLLAPGGYFDRMKTIGTYQQDSSAQSRIMLWKAAFAMSLDYPLGVGAGNFASAYGRYYTPVGDRSDQRNTVVWAPGRWLNAHSIYFKTLGEYGFIGFFMIIGLVIVNLRHSVKVLKKFLCRTPVPDVSPYWPALVGMSVTGFAVGGIFLGGLAYPHMFFLSGLVVANIRLLEQLDEVPHDRLRSRPITPRATVGTRRSQHSLKRSSR